MEELAGPMREVLDDLRAKWKEFQEAEPFLDVVKAFVHAVDWTEPWIVAVLTCHVALLLTALLSRKTQAVQFTIFVFCAAVVLFAEQLNQLGHQHWDAFARQDYFDPSGLFITVVVSAPLLLVMFVLLINYLVSACQLMVQAKRQQLKVEAMRRRKAAEAAVGGGVPTSTKKGTAAATPASHKKRQ